MPTFVNSQVMADQIARMGRGELDELDRVKRDIRFDGQAFDPHRLDGRGGQDLLEGAYARDYRLGEQRGQWRLIYQYEDNDVVRLLGILDYHGGGAQVPLYGLNRSIDVSG